MSTSGGGNGGVGRPTPRYKRQAAMAATNALPTVVKNMEKADRKAKQEQAKSKKKKRSTKSKGGGPAKQNNRGKKSGGGGCVGNNANVFPGHGRLLDSEPSAVADTKKSGATLIGRASINIDKAAHEIDDNMSALIRNLTKQNKIMSEKLKENVAKLVEVNVNNKILTSLTCGDVRIEVAKGGTNVMGGIMLGIKKDYENAGSDTSSGSAMEWKLCIATFNSDTRRGKAVDTFTMYPKDIVCSIITGFFDEKDHEFLSEEVLPSIGNIFWSMAYHFVLENYEFEPHNLVDIYKEMDNGCRDWNSVHNLGERDARRKNRNYKGN